MIRTKAIAAALAAVAIVGALPAFAAEHGAQAETAALQKAKVSLTDAIRVAEQQVNGKAVDAGAESHKGSLRYEVEVLNGGSIRKVTVDGQSGQVVATSADQTHEQENGVEQEQQSDLDQED